MKCTSNFWTWKMCGDNQTLGLFILERTICAKSPTQCRWKCFPRLQILSCGWAAYAGNIFFLQIWVMPNVHRFGPFQSWHSAVTCLQVTSNSWNIYFPTCIAYVYMYIYIMCIYIYYIHYIIYYMKYVWIKFEVVFRFSFCLFLSYICFRCHPGEHLELCWQLRFPTSLAAGAQLQLRESREASLSLPWGRLVMACALMISCVIMINY